MDPGSYFSNFLIHSLNQPYLCGGTLRLLNKTKEQLKKKQKQKQKQKQKKTHLLRLSFPTP